MNIYFDGVLINGDYLMSLTKSVTMFDNEFRLGKTLCECLEMTIDADGFTDSPSVVTIDDTDYRVDSIIQSDETYYVLTLTDNMVLLNELYQIDPDANMTVGQIVDDICDTYGLYAPTGYYMEDTLLTWTGDEYMSARDFIGYVAEVNGAYARIDSNGSLLFSHIEYRNADIPLENCSDFKLGVHHKYSKVEHSSTAISFGTDDYSTYYINDENILVTSDNASAICQNILTYLPEFYDIEVGYCEFDDDISTGDIIHINDYPTIAEIEWSYNVGWKGGFSLELTDEEQEFTEVRGTNDIVKYLKLRLDRDENTISTLVQQTDDIESSLTAIRQTSESIELQIRNGVEKVHNELIQIDANGITVSNNSSEVTSNLDADGLEINSRDGELIAEFKKTGVNTPRLESAKALIGGLLFKEGCAYWVGGGN